MEPVLIYTDTEKIIKSKAFLDSTIPAFQDIYDSFKAIGITPATVQEMAFRVQIQQRDRSLDFLTKYVLDKLLVVAGTPSFNGVPISQDRLRELIAVPDLTSLTEALMRFPAYYDGGGIGSEPDLLQITEDVVEKKENTYTTLEARYTFYTKNDRGAMLATRLFSMAEQMNDYLAYLGTIGWPLGNNAGIIDGLKLHDKVYSPDVNFIRKHEGLA